MQIYPNVNCLSKMLKLCCGPDLSVTSFLRDLCAYLSLLVSISEELFGKHKESIPTGEERSPLDNRRAMKI